MFVKNQIESNESYLLMEDEYLPDDKTLQLKFFNEMSDADENGLKSSLRTDPRYSELRDITIDIKDSDTKSFDLITKAYEDKREELRESRTIIKGLEAEIDELKITITNLRGQLEQDAINRDEKAVAFSRISQQTKIRYSNLERLDFASVLSTSDFFKIDTIPLLTVKWNPIIKDSILDIKENELRTWIQAQMELDTLFIKRDAPPKVQVRDSISGGN